MSNFGLKVKKDGISKHVEACTNNELIFNSDLACAKIVQTGKYDFTINTSTSTTYTIALDSILAFPLVVLVYLYDPSDSSYKAIGSETVLDHTQNYRGRFYFNSSNLYVYVQNFTGAQISSHIMYFICYA